MRPTAAKNGCARSKAARSPPTISTSSPDLACGVEPDTGASRYAMPRAANAAATSRAHAGEFVDESMTSTPASASAMTLSGPASMTARVAASSDTMDHTTLAPLAASAGDAHAVTPGSAASGAALAASRLYTRSVNPLRARFAAIGAPIAPRPMNAMVPDAIESLW